MSGRTHRPHHVQVYLGTDLYERILREAAVQRRSVSDCAREALEEVYAIRDELARPLAENSDDPSAGRRLAHRLLAELEERLSGGLSRQLDEICRLGDQLRRLEAMADRQYISLMLYLPDVSPEDGEERLASANRRYETWRRAVDGLLETAKRRP